MSNPPLILADLFEKPDATRFAIRFLQDDVVPNLCLADKDDPIPGSVLSPDADTVTLLTRDSRFLGDDESSTLRFRSRLPTFELLILQELALCDLVIWIDCESGICVFLDARPDFLGLVF
jgi:hypothetical protein